MNVLPETQQQAIQFHVLRKGEEKPIGPYSQEQLLNLLNEEQIRSSDYVYYPDLPGWKPLSQVFDLERDIPNLGREGQDPTIVSESYTFVDRRTEPGEDIYYVAVQHMPAISLTAAVRVTYPKAVILTNHRICLVTQKLLGDKKLEEYPLQEIQGVVSRIKAGQKDGVFKILMRSGESIEVDKIPFAQLDQLDRKTPQLMKQMI